MVCGAGHLRSMFALCKSATIRRSQYTTNCLQIVWNCASSCEVFHTTARTFAALAKALARAGITNWDEENVQPSLFDKGLQIVRSMRSPRVTRRGAIPMDPVFASSMQFQTIGGLSLSTPADTLWFVTATFSMPTRQRVSLRGKCSTSCGKKLVSLSLVRTILQLLEVMPVAVRWQLGSTSTSRANSMATQCGST
jgi:hypothetical protein